MANFARIIDDFVCDLNRTFPEHREVLELFWSEENRNPEELYEFCKQVYPNLLFDIINQNELAASIELLPGLNFTLLWSADGVTKTTKDTIWKYLQLILFAIVQEEHTTSELFSEENIKKFSETNKGEFYEKLQETLRQVGLQASRAEEPTALPIPDAAVINDRLSGMLGGKLGKIAKDIAEEASGKMDGLNLDGAQDVNDVIGSLFANPAKLMELVKVIGASLDSKMKSGELSEEELVQEAGGMLKGMNSIPGFEGLQSMLSSMMRAGQAGQGSPDDVMGGFMENFFKASPATAAPVEKKQTQQSKFLRNMKNYRLREQLMKQSSTVPPSVEDIERQRIADEALFAVFEKPSKSVPGKR